MAKNGGFYVMSNKVHESSVFWKRRDSKFYSFFVVLQLLCIPYKLHENTLQICIFLSVKSADDCPGLRHQIKYLWFITFNLYIQNFLQLKTNSLIILSTTLFLPVAPLTLVTKKHLLGFHHPPPQLWLPCSSLERIKLDKSVMTLKARRCIFAPNSTWAFTVKSLFFLSVKWT